ncbi:hypothetical protein OH779_02110 [Actinacidiphila glaucinigra]|uniref:hypothetical protein n=1 Tax=Actinacidiphila glaucinigra TaxID=235986 RepID=UPI00386994E5
MVLPCAGAPGSVGAHLLEPAGRMPAAVEFTDEPLILDTSRAPLAGAAIRVRDRLIDRTRHGGVDRADLDETDWIENREYQALTPRTAALLRLAMRQLSQEAWQEVAALGDAALPRDAGGVLGSLPPVTLRRDRDLAQPDGTRLRRPGRRPLRRPKRRGSAVHSRGTRTCHTGRRPTRPLRARPGGHRAFC